jgi:hypothetical protein
MSLIPETDNWIETTKNPDVVQHETIYIDPPPVTVYRPVEPPIVNRPYYPTPTPQVVTYDSGYSYEGSYGGGQQETPPPTTVTYSPLGWDPTLLLDTSGIAMYQGSDGNVYIGDPSSGFSSVDTASLELVGSGGSSNGSQVTGPTGATGTLNYVSQELTDFAIMLDNGTDNDNFLDINYFL